MHGHDREFASGSLTLSSITRTHAIRLYRAAERGQCREFFPVTGRDNGAKPEQFQPTKARNPDHLARMRHAKQVRPMIARRLESTFAYVAFILLFAIVCGLFD
jgi:hypothetical protein